MSKFNIFDKAPGGVFFLNLISSQQPSTVSIKLYESSLLSIEYTLKSTLLDEVYTYLENKDHESYAKVDKMPIIISPGPCRDSLKGHAPPCRS